MRVRIHRGASEIGGNCVEVESGGERILLDVGCPLDRGLDDPPTAADLPGFAGVNAAPIRAVFISHPHRDHWGLAPVLPPETPVFIGKDADRILREAAFFSPAGGDLHPAGFLENRVPIRVGGFTVTPFLMDHSAFDAYSLLVEADGKRLFYTGDFRGHGRKGALFERLVQSPPANVDVLMMEGTLLQPEGISPREQVSEQDVEDACVDAFRHTQGMALVAYSAQNIDRLTTLYRAALRADRDFVMDLYTATVARATGRSSIPQPGPAWPRVKVFVPRKQQIQVKQAAEFERVEEIRSCRLFPEDLSGLRERTVMTFRTSMARDLERAGCLEGARIVWSLWQGYLAEDDRLRGFLERNRIPMTCHHSSGHAFVEDLVRLAQALVPARVVPIHTAAPGRFGEILPKVERHSDGEWWDV